MLPGGLVVGSTQALADMTGMTKAMIVISRNIFFVCIIEITEIGKIKIHFFTALVSINASRTTSDKA